MSLAATHRPDSLHASLPAGLGLGARAPGDLGTVTRPGLLPRPRPRRGHLRQAPRSRTWFTIGSPRPADERLPEKASSPTARATARGAGRADPQPCRSRAIAVESSI